MAFLGVCKTIQAAWALRQAWVPNPSLSGFLALTQRCEALPVIRLRDALTWLIGLGHSGVGGRIRAVLGAMMSLMALIASLALDALATSGASADLARLGGDSAEPTMPLTDV